MTLTKGFGTRPHWALLYSKDKYKWAWEVSRDPAERLAAVQSDARHTKSPESWVHSVCEGSWGKWCNHLSVSHTCWGDSTCFNRMWKWKTHKQENKTCAVCPIREQHNTQPPPFTTEQKKNQQCPIMHEYEEGKKKQLHPIRLKRTNSRLPVEQWLETKQLPPVLNSYFSKDKWTRKTSQLQLHNSTKTTISL